VLNELYDAASSLADIGVSPKDWHKEYTLVPKPQSLKKSTGKPTFFVFIGRDSQIVRIERVADQNETANLRKWEKGNGNSFPYFNIPPLWWISFNPKENDDDKVFKKALDKGTATAQEVEQFIKEKTAAGKEWENKHISRIGDCLHKIPDKLKEIIDSPPPECRAIIELIDRVSGLSVSQFYESIKNEFKKRMLVEPSLAHLYFGAAFYRGKKAPGNNVSILLELEDGTSAFEYPVKHPRVRDFINERMLGHQKTTTKASGQPDAFGKDLAGSHNKYPAVTISIFGKVILRAMNHEYPCQYRYGTINQESCLVGEESRKLIKGALEWLTAPKRKGKTWDMVARAAGNNEILLAYPSVLPEEPPNTAGMFSGTVGEGDTTNNTSRFEDCAKEVTGTLQGLMSQNPNLDFRVFVLRKMDPARTRISSNRRYAAQHLINSARNWVKGCRNLPHILIKQFTRRGRPEWLEPKIPFPMEIVWTLNTLWSLGGKNTKKNKAAGQTQWTPSSVKSVTTDDGISLFLEEGVFLEQILRRALHTAMHNAIGLVLALGQAHAQKLAFVSDKNYARQIMILPSILGLLLFKMNITKEEYMKSPPYLVGRLLSLADQLHYYYCQEVRNNSIPPQLMGNALMSTALEEPVKALALYCNRILPYQAWAKTVSGDAAGLARYFLSELGKVSSELGDVCSNTPLKIIPERCTDSDKAQMLLGYLTRPEKSDSENTKQGDAK